MHTTLTRDCAATRIPSGEPAVLAAGTEVVVTQTLGGHATVRLATGLFRIAAEDAGAIKDLVVERGASPADTASECAGAFEERRVWEALKTCFDPEIPVNIVDLGLIYDVSIEALPAGGSLVEVKMTLTAPGCGMGPVIAEDARAKIAALPGVGEAKVYVVWDPVWTPHMISAEGRAALGME